MSKDSTESSDSDATASKGGLEVNWKITLETISRIQPLFELEDVWNYKKENKDALCYLSVEQEKQEVPDEMIDAMRQALDNMKECKAQGRRLSDSEERGSRLRKALARCYSEPLGRILDPEKEIAIVPSGDNGVEYIFDAFIGDYAKTVFMQPGKPYELLASRVQSDKLLLQIFSVSLTRGLTLFPPEGQENESAIPSANDWTWKAEELRRYLTGAKFLVLETPIDPTGKVYSAEELKLIAELCIEFNVYVIEVNADEHLVYEDEAGNVLEDTVSTWSSVPRMAAVEGMAERTLTVGSAGKSFDAEEWNLGWVIACEDIMDNLQVSFFLLPRTVPRPMVEAAANLLEKTLEQRPEERIFARRRRELRPKRDALVKAFADAGFRPFRPAAGTSFVVDVSVADAEGTRGKNRFERLYRYLVMEKGLVLDAMCSYYFERRPEFVADLMEVYFDQPWTTIQRAVEIIEEWGKEVKGNAAKKSA